MPHAHEGHPEPPADIFGGSSAAEDDDLFAAVEALTPEERDELSAFVLALLGLDPLRELRAARTALGSGVLPVPAGAIAA